VGHFTGIDHRLRSSTRRERLAQQRIEVFVKRLLVMAVLLSAAAWPGLPKDKELNWRDAQLLEISSETIGQGGIHQVGGSVIGPGSGNIWRDKSITYLIQVGDATYTASEFSMAHHKLKPERAKAGQVKVAIKSERF
jgi:hypothetical protein